jgi:putative ABC transport system permease protein
MSTLTIARQMAYTESKDLGFSHGNVLGLYIAQDAGLKGRFDLVRRELLKHPAVAQVASGTGFPGSSGGFPASAAPADRRGSPVTVMASQVGPDSLEFFGISSLAGSGFAGLPEDRRPGKVVLNESAARALSLERPVGAKISSEIIQGLSGSTEPLEVVGVVRDFHLASLHDRIQPTVFFLDADPVFAFIRLRPGDVPAALAGLKAIWERLPTFLPFQPEFIDESLKTDVYGKDKRTGTIHLWASLVSLGLAGLGVFGTAAFTVGRRRREIGIRKVLGASSPGVFLMLIGDLMKPTLLALLAGWPAGAWMGRRWLQGFAYRVDTAWWTLPAAAGMVLTAVLAAVFSLALRASRAQPAVTIRYE